ncbi:MAG: hypothetical protein V4473_01685 [Patescibacteria group bacterium]
MENKKMWFRAKRWGWGWTPVSWQGWVVTLLYAFALIPYAVKANKAHSGSDALLQFAVPFVVLTIFLLIICYTRGEKPGWHWND